MRNWIRFIVIFSLAFFTLFGVIVFYQAQKPIGKAEEKAEARAIEEGHLIEITRSYPVNGTEPSITVLGKDKEGRPKAVFVPDGKKGDIGSVLLSEGISSKEVLSAIREEMNVSDILHVHLGTDGSGPFWEVAFVGQDDKLNYVYMNFKDGSTRKKILNL
ncbi:cell wall elongation regulator TseB-like domain-containing protein [Bhargavaea beijingensis]|uniref:Cell wall elongation regulator TseB-like domain-containing protein n=1 Tax=Bhargavaea beijingensis TaxID=426756 RepID=A0ABX9Z9Q8_9BACL|nr:DUF5590 domain-containing protein [Bhargavaea beijingensis]RSK24837.1 hypothetical protein EJA12_13235 [Bhargavaea beijingensis]